MTDPTPADVGALAAIIRPWTVCDNGGRFDHGSDRAARALLASGVVVPASRVEEARAEGAALRAAVERLVATRPGREASTDPDWLVPATRIRAALASAATDAPEGGATSADEPDCRCGCPADDHVFTGGGICNLCDCNRYRVARGTKLATDAPEGGA